jgi:hypothetical protein
VRGRKRSLKIMMRLPGRRDKSRKQKNEEKRDKKERQSKVH